TSSQLPARRGRRRRGPVRAVVHDVTSSSGSVITHLDSRSAACRQCVAGIRRGAPLPEIDRSRLGALVAREEERFVEDHPRSGELFARAKRSMLGGVPMPWMTEWAGPYPVFVEEAE